MWQTIHAVELSFTRPYPWNARKGWIVKIICFHQLCCRGSRFSISPHQELRKENLLMNTARNSSMKYRLTLSSDYE
jgi:hypothetical protein